MVSANRFAASCFLAFLALGIALLFFHEPWRDELQPWALIRETTSFSDMVLQTRYEGHPSGWFAILYPVSRFTNTFFVAQTVHLFIVAAAVFLLLFHSPFSRLEKGLLVFGYFFIYEYALLARNYSLGMLLLFAVCVLLKNKGKNWLAISGCLFLLVQANVFAAVLGSMLFGVLALQLGVGLWRPSTLKGERLNAGTFILGAGIFLAGLAISILDTLPPADSSFVPGWKWYAPEWRQALTSFYHAMAPVPAPQLHFWNTRFLSYFPEWGHLPGLEVVLAIGILAACIFSLRKHPLALAFFTLSWFAISVFISVKYVGFLRHHGHFFLAYLAALWIKRDSRQPTAAKAGRVNAFFAAMLCLHVVGSCIAVYFDVKYPFSQSSRAAAFIERNYPSDKLVVGHLDYAAAPIAHYLRRPVFYPNQNRAATFMEWSSVRFEKEIKDMASSAGAICLEKGPFLLITNYWMPAKPEKGTSIQLVEKFAPAVVKDEEYWLYEVNCAPASNGAPIF